MSRREEIILSFLNITWSLSVNAACIDAIDRANAYYYKYSSVDSFGDFIYATPDGTPAKLAPYPYNMLRMFKNADGNDIKAVIIINDSYPIANSGVTYDGVPATKVLNTIHRTLVNALSIKLDMNVTRIDYAALSEEGFIIINNFPIHDESNNKAASHWNELMKELLNCVTRSNEDATILITDVDDMSFFDKLTTDRTQIIIQDTKIGKATMIAQFLLTTLSAYDLEIEDYLSIS